MTARTTTTKTVVLSRGSHIRFLPTKLLRVRAPTIILQKSWWFPFSSTRYIISGCCAHRWYYRANNETDHASICLFFLFRSGWIFYLHSSVQRGLEVLTVVLCIVAETSFLSNGHKKFSSQWLYDIFCRSTAHRWMEQVR